ncbi:MAG: hypothetical protein KGL39_33075 [Patescibacteria group bacterium]|nr:hypothetical protein [Patescibacteria group bacterium]
MSILLWALITREVRIQALALKLEVTGRVAAVESRVAVIESRGVDVRQGYRVS